MRHLNIILVFISISFLSFGQDLPKRLHNAKRIEVAPIIDGNLNDEAWTDGKWDGDFIQREPYEGRKPSQPTEFKVRFDNNYLYIAIKAIDSAPDSIANYMSRRDEVNGDMVFVMFDSYHDLQTGFVFGVSSAGVRFDMIISNDGQSDDPSWDPIWLTKSKVHDWGWASELKIPITQIRFKKNSEEVWGLQVARKIFRYDEMSFWQHIPINSPGEVHPIGEMSGLQEILPKKQFDLTPYIKAKYNTYEPEPGNPFRTGNDFRFNAGLDAKIGVTNNITLDLTFNPDFGQVEADPSEVNLTALETFFQEKRPFFIESSNITSFETGGGNLYYSRRIGRKPQHSLTLNNDEFAYIPINSTILGAAKLTGKTENGWSIGLIESVTKEMKAEIDSDTDPRSETIEPLTNYSLARVSKDFNKGETIIGAAITNVIRALDDTELDYLHKSASTAGIDFMQYFKNRNYIISGNMFFSKVTGNQEAIARTQSYSSRYFQRPDASYVEYDTSRTSLSGHGGSLEIEKIGGNLNLSFLNQWKSPGIEINDLGYMPQADNISTQLWGEYKFTEPFSIFRNLSLSSLVLFEWDFGGNINSILYAEKLMVGFNNLWRVGFGFNYRSKKSSNTLLRGGPSILLPNDWGLQYNIRTDDRKKISFIFSGQLQGAAEDYSKSTNFNGSIMIRPMNRLKIYLSPGYSHRYSELQYISSRSHNNEDRYLFGTIKQKVLNMSLRINYNITPDLTIQYWGQPFVAAGEYSEFKMITDPRAEYYSDRIYLYTYQQINLVDDLYWIDEDIDGIDDYGFSAPDFNVSNWLSNLVVRWEFLPGSTAYFVWSQTQNYYNSVGIMDLGEDLKNLFTDQKANNIFLIKFSYRIGLLSG